MNHSGRLLLAAVPGEGYRRGHRPAPRFNSGGFTGPDRPLLWRLGGPAARRGQDAIRRPLPERETSPQTVRFPGGETLDGVKARALAAVDKVVRRHPGQTILLAAHRAVNKVLIAALIGLDNSHFWRIGQDTTAINRFAWTGDTGRSWGSMTPAI